MSDSACTATAYLTGVKANYETIGLSASVMLNDCPGSVMPDNRTQSIADWSMAKGKAVGLVTTTRVTHASPSGLYAHSANRDWESDAELAKAANLTDVTQCEDIAKQLITRSPGMDIKVSIALFFFFRNLCETNSYILFVIRVRLGQRERSACNWVVLLNNSPILFFVTKVYYSII